ncbi:DMT family transporter [Undibacterium rugosum]|uniref:DMT family transporter n=1 Tax=Undibacterium rugosum TaxID=2762291 RepID=UPI001B82D6F0|nr:DMT family transporter [Undibacterium rugosum]MBR7777139.1 DMT family transporter [Undibacterium rugosum]
MPASQHARRHAILLMIIAATLWSSAGVASRHLQSAAGFEIVFWRSLFAAIFVAGLMLHQYRRAFFSRLKLMGSTGMLSGLMWATMYSCFMIALTLTTVANTSVMESLAPLFTALLSWLVLKERIPAATWIAIAMAGCGMAWMFAGNLTLTDSRGVLGMLVALGIPLASSVNMILLKRRAHTVDLIPAVFLGGSFSALAMLSLSLPFQASLQDVLILGALGFFQLGLPCSLMVKASASLKAHEVALLALLEVLLAPLWAWLWAGETPNSATLAGGAIVLAALIINEIWNWHQKPGESQ